MKYVFSLLLCLLLTVSFASAESWNTVQLYPVSLDSNVREFFSVDDNGNPWMDPGGVHYGFPEKTSLLWDAHSGTVSIWASSFLPQQGRFLYLPGNVADGNRNTVWSEGVEGYGIGETLTIAQTLDEPRDHHKYIYQTICIVNGYAQNAQKWRANSRVKALEVYIHGEYLFCLQLKDIITPQYFDISPYNITTLSGEEITFQFRIAEVYPGETYADTCLTGVEFDVRMLE